MREPDQHAATGDAHARVPAGEQPGDGRQRRDDQRKLPQRGGLAQPTSGSDRGSLVAIARRTERGPSHASNSASAISCPAVLPGPRLVWLVTASSAPVPIAPLAASAKPSTAQPLAIGRRHRASVRVRHSLDLRGMRRAVNAAAVAAGAVGGYVLLVRGALTVDLGLGRRTRQLGPLHLSIAAPRETVFDVVAAPYLGRTPRAMGAKLEVLERGTDMVLAAHFTPVGAGLTTTTVETVRFERPERISFRLVRGPVPHVTETFELRQTGHGTELEYRGELGTDFWRLGSWWGERVAGPWQRAVAESLAGIKTEAERRTPQPARAPGR